MIDFNYYINIFDGKKIVDSDVFDSLKDKAIRYINLVTRKPGTEKEIADAVCALCEMYFETDSGVGIKSESVDGMSVTYDNARIERQAYNVLKLYLPQRLLYRGI